MRYHQYPTSGIGDDTFQVKIWNTTGGYYEIKDRDTLGGNENGVACSYVLFVQWLEVHIDQL